MTRIREKAIARLSLSAFAVDVMVVMLFVIGSHKLIDRYFVDAPDWAFILAVPIVLLLHFLVVEFIAGGLSIGRLSTGLMVRDKRRDVKPSVSSSLVRCGPVFLTMGVPSLNPSKLPNYNKRLERCLCSDWAGFVPSSEETRPARPSESRRNLQPTNTAASEWGLQVISGRHKGTEKQFSQSNYFLKNKIFVVGTNAKSSGLALSKDSSISPVHCRIAKKNDRFYILDGKSATEVSNTGTILNGSNVSSRKASRINLGDQIKLGQTTMKVVLL